jgi:hypothetical protein
MKRFIVAGVLLLLPAAPSNAQCPDLVSYVRDLLGEDRELQNRAGKNEACQLTLYAQDKKFFDREVLPRIEYSWRVMSRGSVRVPAPSRRR